MYVAHVLIRSSLAILCATSAAALAANTDVLKPVGSDAIVEGDFVYARAGNVELQAHSYRPATNDVLPAIIDIHGGAWSSGDRMSGRVYAHALASAGLVVISIDFRQGPQFQHPAANQDIAAAVRYVRLNAARLRVDPDSIGLVGSSSGGHLAMLSGLIPNAAEFRGTSVAKDEQYIEDAADAGVRYVIALWPVSDPLYRYEYAQRVGRKELVRSHEGYFGSRESMQRASVPRLLRAKEAASLPPLFVVQPGNDANIPREMTFDLLAAYQESGGRVAYEFYPNQPHAFGHRASPDTDRLVAAMRDFIVAVLRK